MEQIAKAIQAVMTEINGIEKSMTVGEGSSSSYKGVSDKDVRQLLRNSMVKNGLSILPTDVQSKIQVDRWEEVDKYSKSVPKDMKSKQSIFTEVTTKYILLHTSGESITLAGYGQGVDTQDKGAGKATTYALKNTLLNMFLIPTGVDTDNTHSDEYDVPRSKNTRVEDDGITLLDYIDSMKLAKNSEELKELFLKGQKLCKTDAEIDNFTTIKDEKKKEFN